MIEDSDAVSFIFNILYPSNLLYIVIMNILMFLGSGIVTIKQFITGVISEQTNDFDYKNSINLIPRVNNLNKITTNIQKAGNCEIKNLKLLESFQIYCLEIHNNVLITILLPY